MCLLTATPAPTKGPEKEQQLENGANQLAECDFPVLGAAGGATTEKKKKKSKASDAGQKKSNVQVFTDAYHAQLREVHGGNMRAAEAIEEEDEPTSRRRRNAYMDLDYVNSVVKNAIQEIAAEGDLVTDKKVRWNKRIDFDLCLNF